MSIASPFSAWTMTSAPVSAATSIVRNSVSSSTISAPLYAMKSLYEVIPCSGSVASSSSEPPSTRSVTAMWKPQSISCLPSRLACQVSSASAKLCPLPWMQKSMWQVVPPNAAEV